MDGVAISMMDGLIMWVWVFVAGCVWLAIMAFFMSKMPAKWAVGMAKFVKDHIVR